MWREKTDKRIVAAGIIGLLTAIGWMTWKDMHPPPPEKKLFTLTPFMLADKPAELEGIPESVAKLVVWSGDIRAAGGKAPVFTASPVAVVSLPQREMMPLVTLDALPHALSTLYEEVEEGFKPWKDAGNLINDVYVDCRWDSPDLAALGVFVNGLRGHLQREAYVILQVRRGSGEQDTATHEKMANMLKSVQTFVYDLKDVQRPDETLGQAILRLDAENLPFMLRTDRQPDHAALAKQMEKPPEIFGGFVLERDSNQTPRRKPHDAESRR